ncbi:MAG: aminoacyl-tRNA hydrolase [Bacteroidetes bacterium]|nr:aminoacyl-tRNA hydrolase [Rhodothermia bacterium]MCS7155357.1 aminoacyl-tRNA hydrolase [Bacteroidota bacterium]MCX7907550.1 aminoacyl-tRNA hydrolase [Bacteroidota bacterium]MDW8138544.1 aminoacyl-tRNA hydrolase [Bacteroidota bacterium]MDW8284519.1 aminoacyl-tRNA hydrolase [Bacteroidota bacterium]
MALVVGLGNPGSAYAATRHNVGFRVLDELARQEGARFRAGAGDYWEAKVRLGDQPVWLIKPTTYMNRSGRAVVQALGRYSEPLERLLVVVDDLHLPLGTLRMRPKGSAGGHNGLADIIAHLRTEAFPRLRLGIGAPPLEGQQAAFVLSPFDPAEVPLAERMIQVAADAVRCWATEGLQAAMNRYNGSVAR